MNLVSRILKNILDGKASRTHVKPMFRSQDAENAAKRPRRVGKRRTHHPQIAFSIQAVQKRACVPGVSHKTEMIWAQIINHDEDNVLFFKMRRTHIIATD